MSHCYTTALCRARIIGCAILVAVDKTNHTSHQHNNHKHKHKQLDRENKKALSSKSIAQRK